MRLGELTERLPTESSQAYRRFWGRAAEDAEQGNWWEEALAQAAGGLTETLLSQTERDVLRLHIHLHGAGAVEEEALVHRAKNELVLTGNECRMALASLERNGLLFAVKKSWGERLCFTPSDLYASFVIGFYPPDLPIVPRGEVFLEPLPDHDAPSGGYLPLGRIMLYGLSRLAREPMMFTANGYLPKKTVDQLERLIGLPNSVLYDSGLHPIQAERYTPGVALLLDAALALGLAERREKGLALRQDGLRQWLESDDSTREQTLQSWLCDMRFSAMGCEAHGGAALLRMQKGVWHRVADLESWLMAVLNDGPAIQQLPGKRSRDHNRELRRWITLFQACGWLDTGANDQGEALFSLRAFHETIHDEVIVQPDGEVLVGPYTGGSTRWRLEEVAERRSENTFTVYRLTESSIHAALERGETFDGIIGLLKQAGGGSFLPESVIDMLEQWRKSQGAFNSGAAQGKRTGGNGSRTSAAGASTSGCKERFLAEGPQRLWQYPLDSPGDKREKWQVLLSSVPSMWLNKRRSYHSSTSRELMQSAISLEAAVELTLDGEILLFVPEVAEQKDGQWVVTGRKHGDRGMSPLALTAERLDEIRLVVPSELPSYLLANRL